MCMCGNGTEGITRAWVVIFILDSCFRRNDRGVGRYFLYSRQSPLPYLSVIPFHFPQNHSRKDSEVCYGKEITQIQLISTTVSFCKEPTIHITWFSIYKRSLQDDIPFHFYNDDSMND